MAYAQYILHDDLARARYRDVDYSAARAEFKIALAYCIDISSSPEDCEDARRKLSYVESVIARLDRVYEALARVHDYERRSDWARAVPALEETIAICNDQFNLCDVLMTRLTRDRGQLAYGTGLGYKDRGDWVRAVAAFQKAVDYFCSILPSSGDRIDCEDARNSLEEAEYAARPREYKVSGTALVGGTSWIYGFNVPPGEKGERLRAKATELLEKQRELAGIKKEDFIDSSQYNFIIGVAASHDPSSDLMRRVIFDEWQKGQFSAANRNLYASLKNRSFERLDCHSNGAMVCLAALELGDVKTRHVRLFGPQITPKSIERWQRLVEQGEIGSIELYMNEGDPIPGLSYIATGDATRDQLLFREILKAEIRRKAPSIFVKILDCPERRKYFDLSCHSMKLYQSNVRKSG